MKVYMNTLFAAIEHPAIDPVLWTLGPLAVRWYGIAYLAAFIIGYAGLRRMIRTGRLGLSTDQLSDLLGWLVAGVLIGGRLGWWFIYHRNEGTMEPWYEPLAIWQGGMSFHGGAIGVAVALLAWARRRRVSVLNIADCLAMVTPVGLFLGRLANFVNSELIGRPTSLPWGVIFPGDHIARHPSQLYEALLEGPILLLLLWFARPWRGWHEGRMVALFLILYGVFRFAVEFTRQPDAQLGFIAFGWLTMGQLLSGATVIFGIFLWAIQRHRHRATPDGYKAISANDAMWVSLKVLNNTQSRETLTVQIIRRSPEILNPSRELSPPW